MIKNKEMSNLMKLFHKNQKENLGYIKYKCYSINSAISMDYYVDVMSKSGLVIKTKLSYLNKEAMLRFIEENSIKVD